MFLLLKACEKMFAKKIEYDNWYIIKADIFITIN